MTGKGNRPGRKAFSARRNSTIESLPPLNSSTGRSNSAATSRKMWIDSASSVCRWESSYWKGFITASNSIVPADSDMDPALRLVLPGPAARPATAGKRARSAPDGLVPPIVQGVIRQVVLVDIAPDVLLAPVGDRVDLPDPPPLVALELTRGRARRGLLAADAGDPRINPVKRSL